MFSLRNLTVVLLAIALSAAVGITSAAADCCVCGGCPGTVVTCGNISLGCDPMFEAFICTEGCIASGCSFLADITSGSCQEVATCTNILGPPTVTSAPVLGRFGELLLALLLVGFGSLYLWSGRGSRGLRALVVFLTLISGGAALHAASNLHIGGGWEPSDGSLDPTSQAPRWTADLIRGDGNSLSGQVTLVGPPQVNGRFSGQISGNQITGTLTDPAGGLIATVVGSIENKTFRGQYTTPSQKSGSFSWDLGNTF